MSRVGGGNHRPNHFARYLLRLRERCLRGPHARRQPAAVLLLPLLLALFALPLSLIAGCSQPLQAAPPGSASQSALANAVTSLDPNTQGTEAWQQTKGPYAWVYKVDVGTEQGKNRLLQYYIQDDYGGTRPPLGTSNDAQFVAKMNQYAAQYNKADASHPVVGAIDLIDPVVDPFPGYDKLYRHPRLKDDVDHYLKLARDNHLLFFFDVQVGWSTPQHDLTTPLQLRNADGSTAGDPYVLMDYLAQPDVNLSYDPEWDMRPGVVPNSDRGRTTAANINWMIDQLSSLVTTRHLPNKILVVHLFRADEQYNNPNRPVASESWDQIQPKPGVTVIICADGQGDPGAKTVTYNALANGKILYDKQVTLGAKFLMGFKVYTQIPCNGENTYCETPMTPAQVLTLKPTPMMVQYS